MESPTITSHGDKHVGEYRAQIEGSHHVGRLVWVQRGNVRHAEHTEVPPAIGGRGVAARLVEALVADARVGNFLIAPDCSYVAAAFDKHPEWARLLAPRTKP